MFSGAKSRSPETHDPVCGMQLDEKKATAKSEYNGTTYYFCSPSCKAAFDKEPSKYAQRSGPSDKPKEGSGHEQHH